MLLRKVGAPLGLIIFAGVLAGLVMVLATLSSPFLFVVGFIPAAIFFGAAIACYLWLDRWEPEPPRLLIYAFLWGGGFATVFALLVGLLLRAVGLSEPALDVALQAPLVEEFGKGIFLVLMLTGARRKEMNSLTDCLVYAGFVGLGFAFIEDLLYLSGTGSLVGTLFTAALRLILGVFAHPLFTSMTAIGIYFSMRQRSGVMKALCILAGYAGAVLLHGTWNGSSVFFGLKGYLIAYAVVLLPVFVCAVVVAIKSRQREGRILGNQLGRMVGEGLLTPQEAGWLAGLRSRTERRKNVASRADKASTKAVNRYIDAVTELAFVRDRQERGWGSERTQADERELVGMVLAERPRVQPVLGGLAQQAPPLTPGSYTPYPTGPHNPAGRPPMPGQYGPPPQQQAPYSQAPHPQQGPARADDVDDDATVLRRPDQQG